jgi:hypothetical protein
MELCLSDLRKVESEGVWPTVAAGMMGWGYCRAQEDDVGSLLSGSMVLLVQKRILAILALEMVAKRSVVNLWCPV